VSNDAISWANDVTTVSVIGAGTMGEGIAQSFAEAGMVVRLLDVDQASLDRCTGQIAANLSLGKEYGIAGDSAKAVLGRIKATRSDSPVTQVGDAQAVIETVPEISDLKRSIFADLDMLPEGVLLCSNTSSMTMSTITESMKSAARAVGLHYFNPAHIIPAVEVHRSKETSDDTVERAAALLRRTGKVPLKIGKEIPGFAINRLTGALSREIAHLLDEGVVTAEALDEAVKASLGFRLAWVGPMEGADYIGLDTDARVSGAVFGGLSNREDPPRELLEKVERGDLGVKTGKGWYDYGDATREQLLEQRNRKLLRQLAAWREGQKS
jgi:3-hydroxybutyryl-CoA dehydrogenase|tara:strand:+ start:2449 stop:3423 length:975 start_codon:yes stop_codon:yes gene_type:complete